MEYQERFEIRISQKHTTSAPFKHDTCGFSVRAGESKEGETASFQGACLHWAILPVLSHVNESRPFFALVGTCGDLWGLVGTCGDLWGLELGLRGA